MRKLLSYIITTLLIISIFPLQSYASDKNLQSESKSSGYPCAQPEAKYSCSEINEMLTESAIENNIPPEIVKAIAFKESQWSQWKDKEGKIPNVSEDGGIGIMQVTDARFDQEKLKTDIQYNIDKGIQILNEKWELGRRGVIPTVNDNSRDIIEHWYFVVLAYNGVVEVNSPVYKKDGTRNRKAYQEEVFAIIEEFNDGIKLVDLPFTREDFQYEHDDGDAILRFNKMHYHISESLTKSRHLFKEGDQVYTIPGTNLRERHNGGKSTKLAKRMIAEIIDDKIYYDDSLESPGRQWVRYKVKLADGRTGFVASFAIEPLTERLAGASRYHTAVEISKSGWQDGADTVVLAKGDDFPDALTGAPLAYKYDAPILLTETGKLHSVTKEEIKRLNPKKVIILGSTKAVSNAVAKEIKGMGIKTERIGGKHRFDTARLIAEKLQSKSGKAIIATGYNYPDALAIGPYAARNGIPILLTDSDSIPYDTQKALKGISETYIVGGTAVISPKVEKQLPGKTKRISGPSRYHTASAIVKEFNFGNQQVFIATGENFADALTGSVIAAKKNAPLLLVKAKQVEKTTKDLINERDIHYFHIIGGPNVVNVADELAKLGSKNTQ